MLLLYAWTLSGIIRELTFVHINLVAIHVDIQTLPTKFFMSKKIGSTVNPCLWCSGASGGAQQTKISTVYIDNCYKLWHKIHSVLGKDTSVKKIYAVQRITQILPKQHERIQQCLDHLWLVLCRDGDGGKRQIFLQLFEQEILREWCLMYVTTSW